MPSLAEHFGRLSTGNKVLSILSLALLPLGLIALLASLHATRTADLQRRADIRVALTQSTRTLGTELASSTSALRGAADAIAANVAPGEVCARLAAILTAQNTPAPPFALFGIDSAPVCASPGFRPSRPPTLDPANRPTADIGSDGIAVRVPAANGGAVAIANFPTATLARFAEPSGIPGSPGLSLSNGTSILTLTARAPTLALRAESASAAVGLFGLTLTISADGVAFGATEALLTFLPLLMWASAATIGFLVVDRLLIRPLRELRLAVASHVPGTPFILPPARTPAREIRELGETFAKFGNEIAAHEYSLAAALADQTRATREVHHRVKNNLQVVASLISLHARGATAPDAIGAYAAIQRRVDALSIVHRSHYAELNVGGGIELRGLLSELATNLRANAVVQGTPPPISIASPQFCVTQDSAVAVAFVLTELVELSTGTDPHAAIAITVGETVHLERACLALVSDGLRSTPALEARFAARYARVVEGLARQLRAPLERDPETGRFSIEFPVLSSASKI